MVGGAWLEASTGLMKAYMSPLQFKFAILRTSRGSASGWEELLNTWKEQRGKRRTDEVKEGGVERSRGM